MTPNIADIIRHHVSLEVRCIDRLYLHAYMPKLQTSGGLCYFLRNYLGHPIPSPALVVASIIPAATDMLFSFVQVGQGFDTGLVVANTTGDPFGGTANGGARAQNGTVALYFFPAAPSTAAPPASPFCIVTGGTATNPVTGGTGATNCIVLSSLPGNGLSAGGVGDHDPDPDRETLLVGPVLVRRVDRRTVTAAGMAASMSEGLTSHPFRSPSSIAAIWNASISSAAVTRRSTTRRGRRMVCAYTWLAQRRQRS